jgi:hypothetical protein
MPSTSNTVNVNISSPPSTIITTIGSTQLCVGDSVTLIGAPAYHTTWYRDGVICGGGIGVNSLRVGTPGNYTCTFNVSSPQGNPNQCLGYSSNSISVTRIPLPLPPNLSVMGATIFSSLGGEHQWFRNGAMVPGMSDSFLVTSSPGVYQSLRIVSSCYSDTSNAIQIAGVGLDNRLPNGINVYPNPTSGKFYLTFHETVSQQVNLRVYSLHGALVSERSAAQHAPAEPIEIDLTSQEAGIYFLEVQQNASVSYLRLVLNR